MKKSKKTIKAKWIDPDDAPLLTREWFESADLYHGEKLIRRGRPRKPVRKAALNMRVDADVLAAFRATGRGWQTRINAALKEWLGKHPR